MPPRSYTSSVRQAAAAEKRDQVIQAAATVLREGEGVTGFSLDAVARAAGVTRLTVYNQFGSRQGLLEAVFDWIAQKGGLNRLFAVATEADPRKGLEQLIDIFCEFWSHDHAIGRLHDAMALDPEFASALLQRNERRRHLVAALLERMHPGRAFRAARQDATDLIFALTGQRMYQALSEKRSAKACRQLIGSACQDAVERMLGRHDKT
ncbi:TetR/AcrR family transcriptional regulator [Dyella koreensis]|uniref:TetR/AcrR family transcriptional regulator n=1 Tax=Dyella koreensis TaxID=311235 RepID=A0ABW8K7A9_9GAMM